MDAVAALGEHLERARVVHVRRLEAQQARDDLKIVLHPVMDLLEQNLLLAERRLDALRARAYRLLGPLRLRDVVGDALEEERVARVVPHHARLPAHPDDVAVARERAELGTERPAGPDAERELAIAALAIVGVELVEPEEGIAQPFLLREAEE